MRPAIRLAASASMASMRRTAARISAANARRRSARSCRRGSSRPRLRARRSAVSNSTFETDSALRMRRCSWYCLPSARQRPRKRVLVERRVGVAARERVGDDPVGLEERAQHAVRVERPERGARAPGSRRAPRAERCLPLGVVQRELVARARRGSASFSAKKNSNLSRSRSRSASSQNSPRPVGDVVLGGAQQRELGDRAVDEEVDDRVAVVGGGQVLVGADRVDRLGPLGEAGDDAALDQRVERALHAVAACRGRARRSSAARAGGRSATRFCSATHASRRRVSARSPRPSSASVTSDVGVIGVTRLMRTATSKASFWSARLCSSASRLGARARAGRARLASESGSPKRMWMSP